MINVTPQGTVYLCKTPLENDYKHQLTFNNASAQLTYFAGTVVKTCTDNTYIRKDGGIKVDANIEAIRNCNYLYYQNTGFTNRIFYCFITDMVYLSENSTLIKFETDCFQTWYFDLNYKPCFVEREHVSDDTIGLHTVPENLELGEYINNGGGIIEPNYQGAVSNSYFLICFQVTERVGGMYSAQDAGQIYNGVFNGLYTFAVDSEQDASEFIEGYDSEGKGDAIVAIFLAPPHFFSGGYQASIGTHGAVVQHLYYMKSNPSTVNLLTNYSINRNTTLDGYSPKNNKLFAFPFNYLYIDNNAGSNQIFKYEDFTNATPKFLMSGALGQGCSIKLQPVNYKNYGSGENFVYGLNAGKLPICAWNSDYYLNYMTQNGVNIATSIGESVFNGAIFTGMALGSPVAGAAVGAITSTASALAKITQASIVPDQAKGNANNADMNIGAHQFLFSYRLVSIRAEYAHIIDDFFTMYGYKVNKLKTPQITGRSQWNYVKTIDCNIEGDIPQTDLQIIRKMFNNGCTFWHNPANIYNYNLSNSIV